MMASLAGNGRKQVRLQRLNPPSHGHQFQSHSSHYPTDSSPDVQYHHQQHYRNQQNQHRQYYHQQYYHHQQYPQQNYYHHNRARNEGWALYQNYNNYRHQPFHAHYPYTAHSPSRYTPYQYHQTRHYKMRKPFTPREFDQHPDRSSPYSSMYPTKREERIHSYIDPAKQTLIFDIDGTIADIEQRLALAPGTKTDGSRNEKEWNIVLDGNNYHHDRVIPVAWAYLKYIESLNKYNILYLSGRRSKTLKHSMRWLFAENQYPKGFVIHRLKGVSGYDFKQQQLYKLSQTLNVAAYFGDRIIDDAITSIKAGIRPILVAPNEWLFTKHIYGGIGSVIEDVMAENDRIAEQCKEEGRMHAFRQLQNRSVPSAFLDIARKSEFWNMSYDDLVPTEFATELFDEGNLEMLPPAVSLKIEQDDQYWEGILEESEAVMLEHSKGEENGDALVEESFQDKRGEIDDKSGDEEAVRKFIESSGDEAQASADCVDDKTHSHGYGRRRIQFQYESALRDQQHVDGNLRWIPVGQSVSSQ